MYYSAIDDHLFTESPCNSLLSEEIMSGFERISPVQNTVLYRTKHAESTWITPGSSFQEKIAALKSCQTDNGSEKPAQAVVSNGSRSSLCPKATAVSPGNHGNTPRQGAGNNP